MQATKAIQGFLRNSSGTASTFCFNLRVCATYMRRTFFRRSCFSWFSNGRKRRQFKNMHRPQVVRQDVRRIYICDLDTLCAGICATYIYIYIYAVWMFVVRRDVRRIYIYICDSRMALKELSFFERLLLKIRCHIYIYIS